jgi:AcrR family transcriptional regulator
MARKVGLRLDQVLAVATSLADSEGLEAVTLARVAGVLGVRSPSLYSHVDGVAGLRRAMALDAAARLGRDISDAVRGRVGGEALTELAHAYRRFALAHPGLYASMLPTPSREDDEEVYEAFAAPVQAIATVLAGLGVAEGDTVPMVRALRSAVHGFVSLEAAGGFGMPQDVDQSFATLVRVLIAGIEAAGRGRALTASS